MSQFRIAWFVLLFVAIIQDGEAVTENYEYPPSENPNYSLIESNEGHAVIQYRPTENRLYARGTDAIYVGIPVGATFAINHMAWEYGIGSTHEGQTRYQGSSASPEEEQKVAEHLFKQLISTEKREFQELDIVKIDIYSTKDRVATDIQYATERGTVSINRLDFEVAWQEQNRTQSTVVSSLNTGYTKLFHNLCINGDEVASLRRKRVISEQERTQQFHPQVAGYQAEGDLINGINGLSDPRQDGVRVLVQNAGMTAVRASDLRQEGIDPTAIPLDQVRIWHKGEECPISVLDDGNNHFDEGDAVVFYATESDSDYSAESIYYFTWFPKETPAKRIQEEEAVWKEESTIFYPARRVWDEDPILVRKSANNYDWYHIQLDEQITDYPLSLPDIVNEGDISISISLLNKTHRNTELSAIIGNSTASFSVGINSATTIEFVASASDAIHSPTLVLKLDETPRKLSALAAGSSEKVGDVPYVFIDRIDVVYPRLANIGEHPLIMEKDILSSSTKAVRLNDKNQPPLIHAWYSKDEQGIEYISTPISSSTEGIQISEGEWDTFEIYQENQIPGPVRIEPDYPSSLHRKDQGYNYIIIAYETLLESARKLAEWRTDEGFDVLLVNVQDIYDEFNEGYPDCESIRRFLRYAQSEWTGLSPEFVVLVGESTWDHRDHEKTWFRDQVPTYAPPNDPQHYASDEWYAYLWGGTGDYFSDVIIGRISLQTPEEVENYVSKVIQYESESPVGLWKTKNCYIADDGFERYGREAAKEAFEPEVYPDYIDQINFPHETNPYLYHRFVDNPDPEAEKFLNKKYSSACQYAIIDAFDEGMLVAQYIGHGGAQLWSDERIFYGMDKPTSNVLELEPNTRFPFVISWSCFVGYLNLNFSPFTVCLSEEFIRYEDRGAIAMWAPSEKGDTSNHMVMSKLAMRNLFQNGLTRLGEITTFTKAEYMEIQNRASLVNQYILFGDPGANIPMPKERLDVSCTPDIYYGKRNEGFVVESNPTLFDNGHAVVSLSVAGENVYESTPFPFANGRIAHECLISFDEVASGTATARVYAWNETQQMDAWGGVTLRYFKPEIVLANADFQREGEEGKITFDVANHSPYAVQNVRCSLQVGDIELELAADEIAAYATKPMELKGQVPEGIDIAYLSLIEDPEQNIHGTPEGDELLVRLTEPDLITVVPLLNSTSYNAAALIESVTTRIRVPFYNVSDEKVASVTIQFEGEGSPGETRRLTLPTREKRSLDFTVTPSSEAGMLKYQIQIRNEQGSRTFNHSLPVTGKPDLALAEGDFSFSPERPVIGRTVYLRTTVYNVGESPVNNIILHAYDGDPSLRVRLEPFYRSGGVQIERLEPGEMRSVEIVWDPPSYTGLGVHDIHFMVDPSNRIDEMSELNNRIRMPLTLYDLPDLEVSPWSDHSMKLLSGRDIPIWGEPFKIWGRVRNVGDSDARHVRLSFLYNDDEITHFFDHLPIGGGQETSFDVPLVSAKNTLTTYVDKYDLIGEKGETMDPGNNISRGKRLVYQLQMPHEPVSEGFRHYRVTNETQFSAGYAEFLQFDKKKKILLMKPDLEKVQYRISPPFVEDEKSYDYVAPRRKWQWNTRYNSFFSPIQTDDVLRAEFPAPNGNYDVFVELYSSAYDQDETERIYAKTSQDSDYVLMEHRKHEDGKGFYKIGTYSILDDRISIEFKAVPGGVSTSLGDIRFVRSGQNDSVHTAYLSPYFPADGSGGMVEMTWNADIPRMSDLVVKARWVQKLENGELKFFPWARIVNGKEERLLLPGKGKYFQYALQFTRYGHNDVSASLGNVEIKIPCR